MTSIYLYVQRTSTYSARRCVKVTVSCEFKCPELAKYRYKCLRHKVTRLEAVYFNRIGGIKLRLKRNNGGRSSNRVIQILLYEESIQYRKTQTDICVYFYGCDPRPLIICFCGCWYRPKSKDAYCEQWECVPEFQGMGKCVCLPGSRVGTTCKTHEKLLCELTKVVGFLNQVNLFEHPGTAGEGAQTPCQPCEPGAAGAGTECQALTSGQTTCQSETSTTGASTCTYTVHQYNGKQVQVQVECQDVPNTQPPTASSGCYKKLTHKPAGTGNGSNSGNTNNGFRLGDVVYRGNGCTRDTCKIDYYNNGGKDLAASDKWAPLTSVAVYYYNHDTGYCDPLLVELEFAKPGNGVTAQNGDKEYYKLTERNGGNGAKLTWERDTGASSAMKSNLSGYLDSIRYCLKKTVRIQLEKNKAESYALTGKDATNGGGKFEKINNGPPSNGKQIQVQVCECPGCQTLTGRNYKCYQHKLGEALNGKHHLVAGLAFTLPGKNNGGANGVVEIPVCVNGGEAKCPPGATEGLCTTTAPAAPEPTASCSAVTGAPTTGTQIPPVHYNQCMGDVYVFFYAGASASGSETGDTTDTVPLMLRYNGQFYRPYSRDQYFTRWVCVPGLCKTAGECKGGCACCPGAGAADPGTGCGASGPGGADCPPDCPCCSQLVTELDRVNECLNRIDLDPEKASKAGSGGSGGTTNGKGYGLPEQSKGGKDLDTSVGNNRVCLTKQEPTGDGAKAYTRVVHRTKNGFRIGDITYCCKDITEHGVTPTALKNGQCDGPGSPGGASCSASPAAAGTTGNGTIKIEVAKGTGGRNGNGHKNLVNENGWNTVVAYYSCSDQCYRLPQLIVLLNTDGPVKNGEAVTGSNSGKKYGYYVLATKNGAAGGGGGGGLGGGSGYEYTWRLVNGSKSGETPVKLDDKTDFQLLNAAFILLDLRVYSCCTYGEDQICQAITTAIQNQSLKESPGHSGVNRLKNRDITVKDETKDTVTCSGTSPGTCCCTCLKDTGFKAMTHNLDKLVKLNGPFKDPLCQINLIAGLKFLIPTGERGKYRRVTLNGDAAGAQNGSVKYHHPDNGNKVCVYFYCSDPRPLLVCYNGWAYAAKNKDEYDQQKWAKCTEVQAADVIKCGCPGSQQPPPPPGTCDKCPLIKALVGVADFLNPVDVKQVPNSTSKYWKFCRCYCVHKFNGCKIWIRVTSQPAIGSFCYDRFTHTHSGITGKGDGFRLGNIHYNNKGEGTGQGENDSCIKLVNGTSNVGGANGKCISASHDKNGGLKCGAFPVVVVFYYKLDTGHKSPIVVAMCTTDNGGPCPKLECNLYYVLKDRGKKTYTKKSDKLDMSDDEKLSKQLDKALFNNSKKLQIVLSTRPVPTEYKPGHNGLITDVFDTGTGDKSSNQKAAKQLFDVKTRILKEVAKEADEAEKTYKTTGTNALTTGKPLATRDALMHHVTGSTTYKAQLSNGPSSSTPSGSGPTTTQIPVEEVHCPGLQPGGYRCFKHDLVSAKEMEYNDTYLYKLLHSTGCYKFYYTSSSSVM
nr:hypothetical protein MACL_00002237 [Theileria orientalis]